MCSCPRQEENNNDSCRPHVRGEMWDLDRVNPFLPAGLFQKGSTKLAMG